MIREFGDLNDILIQPEPENLTIDEYEEDFEQDASRSTTEHNSSSTAEREEKGGVVGGFNRSTTNDDTCYENDTFLSEGAEFTAISSPEVSNSRMETYRANDGGENEENKDNRVEELGDYSSDSSTSSSSLQKQTTHSLTTRR